MDLIIGGAFQGKLDYAREHFKLTDDDIYICAEDAAPDLSRRCLAHFELCVLKQLRESGHFTMPAFRSDAVIIMDDIFCGVVPIDPEIRQWREECGRVMTAISRGAETVTRIFCGLPLQLK